MADTDVTRLSTFLRHIEDMRNLSVCKICMRSLYEPFILSCGHTYCYTCLASWFVGAHGRRTKKNCPDCRAKVSAQPSPNYVLRDLVHMFIGRAELLPEDETVQEHQQAKEEEAAQLAADRAGPGLFKGVFLGEPRPRMRWGLGIPDPEDNVVRCPRCHWELEEGECLRCGFHEIYESGSGLDSDYDSESMHVASSSEFDAEDDIDHEFDGPMHEDVFDYYNSGMSPITDATDEDEEYGEDDDMDGFIDSEADEDDDDTNSESTMTAYNRHWAQSEGYDNESEARSQVSADSAEPVDRYVGYDHGLRNRAWEASDAETNYDEITEASDYEHALPPPPRRRSRAARFIVSDDDDDEEEEDKETEDQDEEDEVDEGEDISEHSETENTQDPSESEDSDVRPPQPSARRRLHLQSQRARRNDHNHQPHAEGSQRRNSSARGQHQHHQRSHNPQNVSSRRRSGYHQSYNRPGYGRRVELAEVMIGHPY